MTLAKPARRRSLCRPTTVPQVTRGAAGAPEPRPTATTTTTAATRSNELKAKKAKINCIIFFRIDLDDLFAFLIDDWEGRWEDNLHLWNRWTNEECGVPEDCWYCLLERAAEFL